MSAAVALQDALLGVLRADPGVQALVDGRVFDQLPSSIEYPYILLGVSYFRPENKDDVIYRVETFQLDVWSSDGGKKWPCRKIVDAVVSAFELTELSLAAPYACSKLDVVLARITDDPDGLRTHGIIQIEAGIETQVS